jgi:hypothetical protein
MAACTRLQHSAAIVSVDRGVERVMHAGSGVRALCEPWGYAPHSVSWSWVVITAKVKTCNTHHATASVALRERCTRESRAPCEPWKGHRRVQDGGHHVQPHELPACP